ncbi:MAG: DUF3604 domain-containing protein, partial [Desulfobulbaceae bacterium]|nr:DUF3604 domain-containing protein [Desulfobulbaceae bacterium]
ARENTREALFDAMQRRETYATTGSRMTVRFFGGWDFESADANTRQPGAIGYRKGVPIGGDLHSAPSGKSPSFLVAALKDPLSGNLDRIQIIKGWRTAAGELEERVYDVAVSDGRAINADGRCPTPVGNTVDVANASWTNTIGETELITMWAYTRWARYRRVPDAPSSHRLGGRGRSTSRRRLSIVASVSPKRVHSRTRSDSHRSRDPP